MKKNEFLDKLRLEIHSLPYDEVEKTIAYYDEMISDRMEDGSSEDEAVASLGTPESIARDLLAHQPFSTIIKRRYEDFKKKNDPNNTAAVVVIMILLFPVWFPIAMSALSFAASIFAGIGSLIIALWAISLAIGVGGIALIISSVFGFATAFIPTGFFAIGSGIALIGLSILAFVGAYYGTIGIVKLLGLIIHSIKKLFVRGTNV